MEIRFQLKSNYNLIRLCQIDFCTHAKCDNLTDFHDFTLKFRSAKLKREIKFLRAKTLFHISRFHAKVLRAKLLREKLRATLFHANVSLRETLA